MKNNIFDYATSELSQDAFIIWCLYWANGQTSNLHGMSVELLNLMGVRDLPPECKLKIVRQEFNIDILVNLIGMNRMIIIEDKTFTSERKNQIQDYKNKIIAESKNPDNEFKIDENVEITTVYFKTGYFFDSDKKVQADFHINSHDFLRILSKYKNENILLDYYYDYLHRIVQDHQSKERYDDVDVNQSHSIWNVAISHIAQYRFLRDIFPEDLWDGKTNLYEVELGKHRNGSEYAMLNIYKGKIETIGVNYSVFWRVEKDKKGPYIALRLNGQYDKKNEKLKQVRNETFYFYRKQVEDIISTSDSIGWHWNQVKGGKTDEYVESTLMILHLNDALLRWDDESNRVIQGIREITERFLAMNS
jgi:hypothetical protein